MMEKRATRLLVLGCLLAPLAGCASDVSLSDRLAGSDRVRGDGDAVTVTGMGSRVEALPLAVGHCAKYGRSAQFDRKAEGAYLFRCVAG